MGKQVNDIEKMVLYFNKLENDYKLFLEEENGYKFWFDLKWKIIYEYKGLISNTKTSLKMKIVNRLMANYPVIPKKEGVLYLEKKQNNDFFKKRVKEVVLPSKYKNYNYIYQNSWKSVIKENQVAFNSKLLYILKKIELKYGENKTISNFVWHINVYISKEKNAFKILKRKKTKVLYIEAGYLNTSIINAAKKLKIKVIEIQYSTIQENHLGYGKNLELVDKLYTWKWQGNLPNEIYIDIKKILIIDQTLYSKKIYKYIEENLINKNVTVLLHRKKNIKSYPGCKTVYKNIDIQDYELIIGYNSTLLEMTEYFGKKVKYIDFRMENNDIEEKN